MIAASPPSIGKICCGRRMSVAKYVAHESCVVHCLNCGAFTVIDLGKAPRRRAPEPVRVPTWN